MKVSDVLRLLQEDGWFLVATRGSHRQFKHSVKSGRVIIPGKPSDDLAPGTHSTILKQGYFETSQSEEVIQMRYAIVIEKAEGNFSAYAPDLLGCVATGATVNEVETEMRDAISFHLAGMREDGVPIPAPSSAVEYLDIAV